MQPQRVEDGLRRALNAATADAPPQLAQALWHAVFSGGGRVRPRLVLGVAKALGDPRPELTDAAAVAVELMHCASLVHDDLPCFDNAQTRRGVPSVHKLFGEELAVLAGDALIVAAFAELPRIGTAEPSACARLGRLLASASGASRGLIAGQAWESESEVDLERYHRAKAASLFEAAVTMGAVAARGSVDQWRPVGTALGLAYQVADDLADAFGNPASMGKATGKDEATGRPNAVAEWGATPARERVDELIGEAVAAIPVCGGRDTLVAEIEHIGARLWPDEPVSGSAAAAGDAEPMPSPAGSSREIEPAADEAQGSLAPVPRLAGS